MLNDSRATVAIVSEPLVPQLAAIPRDELPYLQHLVIDGAPTAGAIGFDRLLAAEPAPELELTSKDDAAFWLYSSGTTGFPKGAVHLHHDIVHTVMCYAQGILGMTGADRTFSVAKLFFAYGLGNALTFPFAVGATTILWPGPPAAPDVYATIERFKPTLLYSVPTNYGQLLAHQRQGGPAFDLYSLILEGHWSRTGDKYSRDPDGYYWYAGRQDDMLKVGGIWVSPVEIENTLLEHPAVQEAGVVGREDQDRLLKPAAYVVLKAGVESSAGLARELQDF